jgi:hypothetical protein
MSKVRYPKKVLHRIKRLIRMYEAIAAGKDPEWVCLCAVVGRCTPLSSSRRTWKCPASRMSRNPIGNPSLACEGPGGDWIKVFRLMIHESKDQGRQLIPLYPGPDDPPEAAVRKQAGRKARAWRKWLNRQEMQT